MGINADFCVQIRIFDFSAFFEIYKIRNPLHRADLKNSENVHQTFSQKIFLGLYELFRWVYVRCDDVNVSPGSSTSPPSDPGRETVFTD